MTLRHQVAIRLIRAQYMAQIALQLAHSPNAKQPADVGCAREQTAQQRFWYESRMAGYADKNAVKHADFPWERSVNPAVFVPRAEARSRASQ
jgi:hypothetical protein